MLRVVQGGIEIVFKVRESKNYKVSKKIYYAGFIGIANNTQKRSIYKLLKIDSGLLFTKKK